MRWIVALSSVMAGMLLAIIVIVTSLAVFYRYYLDTPFVTTEELSRVLLILMTFGGCIALPKLREHMAVEVGYDFAPRRWQRVFDIIHYLIGTAFVGFLSWSGFTLSSSMKGVRLPALQYPVSWLFTVVAAACALHALVYAKTLYDALRSLLPGHDRTRSDTPTE